MASRAGCSLGPPETVADYRDASNEWLLDCPRLQPLCDELVERHGRDALVVVPGCGDPPTPQHTHTDTHQNTHTRMRTHTSHEHAHI